MNEKPLPRSSSSVSGTRAGATRSDDFSRKNVVPTTASSPWASRSSPASSSSPVASGTRTRPPAGRDVDRRARGLDVELLGAELLRALPAVAGAPAEVGAVHDHGADAQDAVDERLRPRRAARDVQVDREELVGRHDRVVVED